MMVEIDSRISAKIKNMGIVCAILVVIMHCRPRLVMGSAGWWVEQCLEFGFSYCAMPFFFLLSGFLLSGKYGKEIKVLDSVHRRELKKRFASLVVPYFLWMILWYFAGVAYRCVLWSIRGGVINGLCPTSISGVLRCLGVWPLGLTNLTVLWFVRNLLVLVCLSPIIFRMTLKFRWRFLVAIFMLYAIFAPWPERTWAVDWRNLFWDGALSLVGAFWFSFGMAIRQGVAFSGVTKNCKSKGLIALIIGLALILARALFLIHGNVAFKLCGFLSIPFSMFGLWALMPSRSWPIWLTGSCFAIYVIHKFVQLPLRGLIKSTTGLEYLIFAVISVGMSFAIAVLLKRYFSRAAKVLFGGR